jgi:hypothetical protein
MPLNKDIIEIPKKNNLVLQKRKKRKSVANTSKKA